jgi:hypothetical protein
MIRFSKVNKADSENHNPQLQRHHLIPLQVSSISELTGSTGIIATTGFQFDDFSTNGILLPCCEKIALETGRPLHRGPHPRYNEIVITSLYAIDELGDRMENDRERKTFYRMRMMLLLSGLRQGLANRGFKNLLLNSRDPVHSHLDFGNIDSDIEKLFPVLK